MMGKGVFKGQDSGTMKAAQKQAGRRFLEDFLEQFHQDDSDSQATNPGSVWP